MQYFISIADTGSFTKAAIKTSVAQSALSRRIRELEAELGVALFYRNGRGVTLTEAGETFLKRARNLAASFEDVKAEIGAMRDMVTGTVVLGVPPSVGLVLLAPLLQQTLRDYPGIKIQILEGFSGHVVEWLANGRVDLAVLYNIRASSSISTEHLLNEDLRLVSASSAFNPWESETVELHEISKLPLILPGRPHGLRLLVDEACQAANVKLRIDLELETLPTIKTLVASGNLRTILPDVAVAAEVAAGQLVTHKISSPGMSRELVLGHAPQKASAPATRIVAKLIRSHIKRMIDGNIWHGGTQSPNR